MAKRKKTKGKSKSGFLGIAMALIIILVAVYVGYQIDPKEDTPTGEVTTDLTSVKDPNTVLVYVNSEPITQGELDLAYEGLSPDIQAFVEKDSLLTELIDELLLTQEADKLAIEVSDEEIESTLDNIGAEQQLTRADMESILLQQGMTLEEFKAELKSQLRLQKLFEEAVPVPEVPEEEIDEAYKKLNPVVVRHILMQADENETGDELFNRSLLVLEEVSEDRENFCELVIMHSQDPGSLGTCGEYRVFEGSGFVPEFELAALSMEIDEVKLVPSQFGVHLMWKVEKVPLEEVREDIINTLNLGASRDLLADYIDSLRIAAEIVYPEETVLENMPEEEMIEIVIEEDLEELPETEVVVEELPEEEIVVELEEELEEEVVEEVLVEELPEEEVGVELETEVLVDIEEIIAGDLMTCLEQTTLYGAYWDSQTKRQLQLFEEMPDFYVECFEKGSFRTKKAVCEDIQAFPTWEIDGELVLGFQTINSLKGMTGC